MARDEELLTHIPFQISLALRVVGVVTSLLNSIMWLRRRQFDKCAHVVHYCIGLLCLLLALPIALESHDSQVVAFTESVSVLV